MTTPLVLMDPNEIQFKLKSLDFIKVNSRIETWIERKVVGWNISAPSFVRKPQTLKMIQEYIDKNKLPLTVEDDMPAYKTFKLMLIL